MKLRLLLLSALTAALLAGCSHREDPQAVNALLGDAGFIARMGFRPGPATDETLRIRLHLAYVEQLLRKSDHPGMTDPLLQRRQRMLALLQAYREAGRFPRNRDFPGQRVPCFIDDEGAICAVGYLVEMTAGRAAAEAINRHHRYEQILDMHDDAVDAWIAGSGLTKAECAMIQPTYGWYPAPVQQNTNSISRDYGIGTALLSGLTLTTDALNVAQISGTRNNNILPGIGLAAGLFQVALGFNNWPDADANGHTNESQKSLSLVNIGLGTTSVLLSTWILVSARPAGARRTNWSLYSAPGTNGTLCFGGYCSVKF
jgi:hypothetical protein